MNKQKYFEDRAVMAATLYPHLHATDIGFYQTLFRNKSTGEVRYHNEWRPNDRPELSKMPPPAAEGWEKRSSMRLHDLPMSEHVVWIRVQ